MKKLTVFVLLLLLICLVVQAQQKYSQENLEKASQEELDLYLNDALKLQKTGRVFNIIGASSLGVAGLCALLGSDATFGVDSWALIVIGGGGLIVGGTSLAIGIPTNLTGKKRVEKINSIKATAFYDVNVDLRPCFQYNLTAQNYQPGLALRIRF